MNHLKRVKRFVAGSDKYFDIYSCTVDEVDEYYTDAGKQMIKITIGENTYSGLYNKWVFEYLQAEEGQPSFVVLWDAPKGKKMVAYVKEIWQDHINGIAQNEVPEDTNAHEPNGEAFVYMWIDKDTDKKYIGKHLGSPTDGYVCSSESLLVEMKERPTRFMRTILAYGSNQDMYELETKLLLDLKTRMSPLYFNLSNNLAK
jgi:hypothetical protein